MRCCLENPFHFFIMNYTLFYLLWLFNYGVLMRLGKLINTKPNGKKNKKNVKNIFVITFMFWFYGKWVAVHPMMINAIVCFFLCGGKSPKFRLFYKIFGIIKGSFKVPERSFIKVFERGFIKVFERGFIKVFERGFNIFESVCGCVTFMFLFCFNTVSFFVAILTQNHKFFRFI